MITAAAASPKISGGAFLIEEFWPGEVFTAEDLSQEHLAISRTVDEFWANDVEPHLEAIRQQRPGIALNVLPNRPAWDSPQWRFLKDSAEWKWIWLLS